MAILETWDQNVGDSILEAPTVCRRLFMRTPDLPRSARRATGSGAPSPLRRPAGRVRVLVKVRGLLVRFELKIAEGASIHTYRCTCIHIPIYIHTYIHTYTNICIDTHLYM